MGVRSFFGACEKYTPSFNFLNHGAHKVHFKIPSFQSILRDAGRYLDMFMPKGGSAWCSLVTQRDAVRVSGREAQEGWDIRMLRAKTTADGDCSHEIKDAYSLEGKL